MIKTLFELDWIAPEPSELTAFSGNRLNRSAEYRDDDCLKKALAIKGAHIFAFTASNLILKPVGSGLDPLFEFAELAGMHPDFDNAILLGYRSNGEPRIAVCVLSRPDELPEQYILADARRLFRESLIESELLGEAAQAIALLNWNANSRFCGRCGSPTEPKIGGYKRLCTSCQHQIFPRTDPVVIMLIIDVERNRCLLGHSHNFQPGMYSCLAGFVEPGETIENAVRRESLEESAIVVGRVHYHASQPWPMPHTLMVGCYAEAISTEIRIDSQEMQDVRWFDRIEAASILHAGPDSLCFSSFKGTIAYRLLQDWIDGTSNTSAASLIIESDS